MKKIFKAFVLAVIAVGASVLSSTYAEDAVRHINYDFDGGKSDGVVFSNTDGCLAQCTGGLYGKTADDYVYEISSSNSQNTNPFGKISTRVEALNNEFMHIRATFGSEDYSAAVIGLGGKIIYNDEAGNKTEGFLNGGTTISIANGEIACFGTKIEGVTLRPRQFYTIDMVLSIGDSAGNTFDVFVNGNQVADDITVTSSITGNSVKSEAYQILGFVDFRLNIGVQKGKEFYAYFDDIAVETAEDTDEFYIMPALEPISSVILDTDCFIARDNVEGMNSGEIAKAFNTPENCTLELINKLGKKLRGLTKTNYLRLTGEECIYLYRIEEASGDEERYKTYYINTMENPLNNGVSVSGIGDKEENDKSTKFTAASAMQSNTYFDEQTIGDRKLVIELKFYAEDLNAARSIEAVSSGGKVFARLLTLTTSGEIQTGAPAATVGSYEPGSWYTVTAVVNDDLSFDYYIGETKADTEGLKFSNIIGDNNNYGALSRFKISITPSGGESVFYLDDIYLTIADEYPYKSDALKGYLYSEEYLIDSDGTIYITSPNLSAAEVLAQIDADDTIALQGLADSDIVGFDAVLTENTDVGAILHKVMFNKVTENAAFYSGGAEIESLADAGDTVSFKASFSNKTDSTQKVCLILAVYKDGILKNMKIKKSEINGYESLSIISDELDCSMCDTAAAWLIDGFTTRKPLSKEFIIK